MKSAENGTIRKAFVMRVHPGCEGEYEQRHRSIWPELERTLIEHGVVTYSIFLNSETRELFAYVEFRDEAQWEAVARTEACRRWWAHMRNLMPSRPDNSPVSRDLKEVFHIES
jgi:L-rhamnose mutarotase